MNRDRSAPAPRMMSSEWNPGTVSATSGRPATAVARARTWPLIAGLISAEYSARKVRSPTGRRRGVPAITAAHAGRSRGREGRWRSEEHTSELQSHLHLLFPLLL